MANYKIRCKQATPEQWVEKSPKNDAYIESWENDLLSPLVMLFHSDSENEAIADAVDALIFMNKTQVRGVYKNSENALYMYELDSDKLLVVFYAFTSNFESEDSEKQKSISSLFKTLSNPEVALEEKLNKLAGVKRSSEAIKEETLSLEDQKKNHEEILPVLNDLQEQISDISAATSKYGDFLKLQEEQKAEAEREKAHKKAAALAVGKSEKDVVNMFATLTNEKIMNRLNRTDSDFFKTYEEDFAALKKSELLKLRKQILSALTDESLCKYYCDRFKEMSLEDRIAIATQNLFNVMPFSIIPNEYDLGKRADFAIEQTRCWYSDAELLKVQKSLYDNLEKDRANLNEQIKQINVEWTKYDTAHSSLQINIYEKGTDEVEKDNPFVIDCGKAIAKIGIYTPGIFRMGFDLINAIPWYWGVSVLEIWKDAQKNSVRDNRDDANDGDQIAKQAYEAVFKQFSGTSTY